MKLEQLNTVFTITGEKFEKTSKPSEIGKIFVPLAPTMVGPDL